MKFSLIRFAGVCALALSSLPVQAVTVSRDFVGNDCSGYFGQGFDACTIFINSGGQRIELSPVIAKYERDDINDTLFVDEVNTTVYPSVNGTEFSFSNTSPDHTTGDWTYNPGVNDPGTRYWATKAGNDFTLFWEVDTAATSTGGACTGPDLYTLACLNEAMVVSTGDWTTATLGDRALSHITFYDSAPPFVVPVPATVWLFGSGLLGLVGMARRKRA